MKNPFINSLSLPILLAINGLIALLTVSAFITIPYGTHVRPMAWASTIFLSAATTFLLGVLLITIDALRGKSKRLIYSFVLCLTPFPLALLMFKIFILAKGFELAP